MKSFLTSNIEGNAVLLPGRTPGFKNDDIKLLSSSDTKMSVWRKFKKACQETEKQAVSYTKFIDLWQQFHPNVVVVKPMTDLSLTCQQNTSKLLRSANLPDWEKSECTQAQQEHLNCVQTERELYRRGLQGSKNQLLEAWRADRFGQTSRSLFPEDNNPLFFQLCSADPYS